VSELPEVLFTMSTLADVRLRGCPLPADQVERLRRALPNCTIY
jgi:hypothetical protein